MSWKESLEWEAEQIDHATRSHLKDLERRERDLQQELDQLREHLTHRRAAQDRRQAFEGGAGGRAAVPALLDRGRPAAAADAEGGR
jgi:hypothetical protein